MLQRSDEIQIVATDPMAQCVVVRGEMDGYVVPLPRFWFAAMV